MGVFKQARFQSKRVFNQNAFLLKNALYTQKRAFRLSLNLGKERLHIQMYKSDYSRRLAFQYLPFTRTTLATMITIVCIVCYCLIIIKNIE